MKKAIVLFAAGMLLAGAGGYVAGNTQATRALTTPVATVTVGYNPDDAEQSAAVERAFHEGEQVGAKIALAIDDPTTSYRADEVWASCDDDKLFGTDECPKCHKE